MHCSRATNELSLMDLTKWAKAIALTLVAGIAGYQIGFRNGTETSLAQSSRETPTAKSPSAKVPIDSNIPGNTHQPVSATPSARERFDTDSDASFAHLWK